MSTFASRLQIKIEKLTLIIMEQAEAYHQMAKVVYDNERHTTSSFSNCAEEVCSQLVKTMGELDIIIEPNSTRLIGTVINDKEPSVH